MRVNDIQLKFGKNSDKQGFFLDGNHLNCDDEHNRMITAFVGIQNEKVVTSICKNSGGNDEHIKYNQEIRKNFTVSKLLSLGYEMSKQDGNPYGDVYYKKYAHMEFHEARKTCEKDGTSLPVPRSGRLSFDQRRFHRINCFQFTERKRGKVSGSS